MSLLYLNTVQLKLPSFNYKRKVSEIPEHYVGSPRHIDAYALGVWASQFSPYAFQ